MKKFYTTLAMAMVIAITSFAQLIPQGTSVPYTGMKKSTANVTKDNVLITPPEDAVIEDDWAIDAVYYYAETTTPYINDNPISVAFSGDNVYFKGVVLTCPDAWIKGRLVNDVLSFNSGQYCGTYGDNEIYACGSEDAVNFSSIVFQYNAVANKFVLGNLYLENIYPDQGGVLLFCYQMTVYKNPVIPAPTDLAVVPDVTTAQVSFTSDASKNNLRYREKVDVTGANRFWDFEDEDQVAEFTLVDADGDGRGWTWSNDRVKPHSGTGIMYSASYDNSVGPLTPDNWIITPLVKLGGQVSFWACSQENDATYASEKFQVYVYEGDEWTSVDEFIAVSDIYTTTIDYQQVVADLSSYEGNGYIAIRHFNCTDQFWLNIDDLEVTVPDASGVVQHEWTVVESVTSPYTIFDLQPETKYEVQVCAVENNHSSPWTQSVDFTTLPEGGVVPTIDELYLVGSFNGWNWQNAEGRVPLAFEDDVFSIEIELEDGTEFKLITPDETSTNGWKWFGGVDENQVGYFEINEGLLNQPIQLVDGANFKVVGDGKYTITVMQPTDDKGLVEPLVMTVSKEVTGISTILTDKADSRIFDLQGRKLNSVPAHGIYIQNGKKYVK